VASYYADNPGDANFLFPDLQKTDQASALAAATKSKDSFDITLKLPLTRANKIFSFWFNYQYQDPDTLLISEGPRSPIVTYGFDIPNLTKGVLNLTLTAGFKSYGVKFTIDPTSVQEDIVIFESLTADFANQYIVYVGTSTNVTINTSDFAPRWVKVRSRDKWLTQNNTDVIAVGPDAGGSVTPKNADPDTSTPPSAPGSVTPIPFIDAYDKTGFSAGSTFNWTANTDTNTAGYVIRWTTENPATTTNPIWEYGQVDGKTTTTFTTTGLLPNTLYYYQVTAKSPYNAISWLSPYSGTLGPIVDPTAPTDVWAQLKSILSIGGKTADLFKIGTGITQSINTSTTITPSMSASLPWSGIILNRSSTNFGHNYWLNTGQFRVGSATNFLYWDGSDLYTTGKINATGGSFTGDVQLNGGTLYAGALPNSGARVRLDNAGIFAYDSNNNQTVAITQADGKLDARKGYIGGWNIDGTAQTTGSIYSSNTKIESNGTITLGDTTGTLPSIIRLSATDPYRLWIGSQSSSAAAFKVDSSGKLYATGAVIDGNTSISGTVTIGGATASTVVSNAQNALQADGTFSGTISSSATINGVAASNLTKRAEDAFTAAQNALPSSSFNRAAIVQYINSTSNNPTNTTYIDGGTIHTGTISADAVVTDFISAFSINANNITTGTLSADKISGGTIGATISITTPNITVGTEYDSYYFRTNQVRSGTSRAALGLNNVNMISADSAGMLSSWYPYNNNDVSLGIVSPYVQRFKNAYLVNNPNVSSDIRLKKDITATNLGLDFIKSLNPVQYKLKARSRKDKVDENGNVVYYPGTDKAVSELNEDDPGNRYHYGFIAQEVKSALDLNGVGEQAGLWAIDNLEEPDSTQALVYSEFISPLTKAVQELANMVESLQQEISELKGK